MARVNNQMDATPADKQKNTPKFYNFEVLAFGAAIQIRTGDLILTKDALYQLSYISIRVPASESH